mmetsp:Transcript_24617/g.53959  ORF Transcript_24617/g.53959 Transcript_24617/m.53959 type:complete len:226 (+) Transcript_24617:237-914(+)
MQYLVRTRTSYSYWCSQHDVTGDSLELGRDVFLVQNVLADYLLLGHVDNLVEGGGIQECAHANLCHLGPGDRHDGVVAVAVAVAVVVVGAHQIDCAGLRGGQLVETRHPNNGIGETRFDEDFFAPVLEVGFFGGPFQFGFSLEILFVKEGFGTSVVLLVLATTTALFFAFVFAFIIVIFGVHVVVGQKHLAIVVHHAVCNDGRYAGITKVDKFWFRLRSVHLDVR